MRRGALWSLTAAAAGGAGTLLVTPALIDALGVADFGLYLLIVTVTSYAMYVDLGLPWASTRYFADDLAHGRTAMLASRFHTTAGVLLGIGIAAGVVAMISTPSLAQLAGARLPRQLDLVVALAAIAVTLSLQSSLVHALLRAQQRFDALGRVLLAGSALLPLATIVAVRIQPSLTAAIAANLLVAIATLFLSLRAAQQTLPRVSHAPRFERARLAEMIAFSGWSCTGRIAMLMMLQLDRLIIAVVGSVTGLAHYAVAAQLAARVNLLGGVSTSMFYSRASALHATAQIDELRRQHGTLRRMLLCASLTLTLPLVTLGPAFFEVWIGPEMRTHGGPILVALALGHGIIGVTSIDAAVIEGAGRADLTAMTMLAWVLIAGVAGVLLHPWLGGTSIAAAVGLWLAGVGFTTLLLRRSFLTLGHESRLRTMVGAIVAVVAALVVQRLLEARVTNVITALAAMAACGAVVGAAGVFLILRRHDRALVFQP